MVTIYTSPSCTSCRKAKRWLKEYGIEYKEKNIANTILTKKDIYSMLVNAENGFEDIISTRSKYVKETGCNFDEMTTSDLVDLIIEEPSILRRPIIIDNDKMQVGYNDEDIRTFIPLDLREMLLADNDGSNCNETECMYIKTLKEKVLKH